MYNDPVWIAFRNSIDGLLNRPKLSISIDVDLDCPICVDFVGQHRRIYDSLRGQAMDIIGKTGDGDKDDGDGNMDQSDGRRWR